jgi:membrane-associated PAP2 superfamily phosphatase
MRRRAPALFLTFTLLAGSLALFQFSDLDVRLQDQFFDFDRGAWLVDRNAKLPRLLFYTGPKVVIIALGTGLLLAALAPRRWKPVWLTPPWPTRRITGFLACLVAVPALIGLLKAYSDVYCPWDLQRYGGGQPFHHLFDPVPPPGKPDCGRCFPAGHASGGFALMALALLLEGPRARRAGLALGLITGWTMGIYQMLKGAHFLSHTIATMFIAAIIIQIIARVAEPPGSARGNNPT